MNQLRMEKFDLSGKTAIVTGGGSGIGRSICEVFASAGAKVYVLDLNSDRAREVAGDVTDNGGKAESFTCDVSKHDEVVTLFNSIHSDHPIHILINNAGIAHVGNIENTTVEDMDRVYAVNVKGVYNCLYAVIPLMKKDGGGAIVNMASIASKVGIADRFAYSMSKGAVLTMTYSVAKDYLDYHIRCNSISPARIHTPFVDGFINENYAGKEKEMFGKLSASQPIGRMGSPEEVAYLALYLCSDEASFITGTDYPIDGGFIKLNG